ncbi:MAG: T9SS type A sorting domain-containing protein, partial [Tunicatimonas sp.]
SPITIYPNPSRAGQFTLQTNGPGNPQVSLYNQQGQLVPVIVKQADQGRWQVTPAVALTQGLYFVVTSQPNGAVLRQKLVVSP